MSIPKYAKILINKNALVSIKESINIGKQLLERKLVAYRLKTARFEEMNNMDTKTFSELFNKGKLGDKKEWLKWDHSANVVSSLEKKLSDLEGIRYES